MCPKCKSIDCREIYHYPVIIDELDHSHMICNKCSYEFNKWNESFDRIKEVFGHNFSQYL